MFVSFYNLRQVVPKLFDCFHAIRFIGEILQTLSQILKLTADMKHQHGDKTDGAGVGHGATVSRQDLTQADQFENWTSSNVKRKISSVHQGTSGIVSLKPDDSRNSKYHVNSQHGLRKYSAPNWYFPNNRGTSQHGCPFVRRFWRMPILIEKLDQQLQDFGKIFYFAYLGENICLFSCYSNTIFFF